MNEIIVHLKERFKGVGFCLINCKPVCISITLLLPLTSQLRSKVQTQQLLVPPTLSGHHNFYSTQLFGSFVSFFQSHHRHHLQ